MTKRWKVSALFASALWVMAASQALPAQQKKSRQNDGAQKQEQEQPSEQEAESRKERPRIRVLSDPMEISSFYRRSGGSYYPRYYRYYGYPPATAAPPPAPESISRFYRSQESWVNPYSFYPGAYPPYGEMLPPGHYGRRGLFDRAQRPGFFLEALPRGFCACPCEDDGN
jgi:hypothetical protein